MTETPPSGRTPDRNGADGARVARTAPLALAALRLGAIASVVATGGALALQAVPAGLLDDGAPVAALRATLAGLAPSDLIAVLAAGAVALATLAFGRDVAPRRIDRRVSEPAPEAARVRRLELDLERAEATRERLLAGISRDLRTPMSGIVGNADLLLAGELPAAERRYAEALVASARDTLAVVDALLEPATADANANARVRLPDDASTAAAFEERARPDDRRAAEPASKASPARSATDGSDDVARAEVLPIRSAAARRAPRADAPAAHVLIVEDDAVNQAVARGLLENLGCAVSIAGDGHEAVEVAGERPFDLILMDCQMPRMDGYRATGAIREREGPNRRAPIVALTANAMAGDRQRCRSPAIAFAVSATIGALRFGPSRSRIAPVAR